LKRIKDADYEALVDCLFAIIGVFIGINAVYEDQPGGELIAEKMEPIKLCAIMLVMEALKANGEIPEDLRIAQLHDEGPVSGRIMANFNRFMQQLYFNRSFEIMRDLWLKGELTKHVPQGFADFIENELFNGSGLEEADESPGQAD
jgi:hypothetical protein